MQNKSGIEMTRENRLGILKRAREILSNPGSWTRTRLHDVTDDGKPQYCVLGACEQAAYDLGLAAAVNPFWGDDDREALGYLLGNDLSINEYAREKYSHYYTAYEVNDSYGYEAVIELLDGYIERCEAGAPLEPPS